ncbi:glycosyltransferase family 2 protein [Candidatus Roizmanbacteria bacterium]|nr:glycosyltransferase family 2 protein [Candidatus Roizmanbacteria bacterium]
MDLSIIIVNYYTEKLLKKCISSIISSKPNMNYEIIVVDNGSSSDIRRQIVGLRKSHKNISLIQNKENVGFGKANNQAVTQAKGEYILFLNVDTEVLDNAVTKLFTFIHDNKHVSIAGAKLLNPDKTDQPSCGPFYSLPVTFGMLFLKGDHINLTRWSPQETKRVDWLSGACMIMKKDLFESLGGFDEGIFMYMEEVEFLHRAKDHRYDTYFYPGALVMHIGAAASGSKKTPVLNIYRGLLYYYTKHRTPQELLLLKLMLKTKAAISYILGILSHNSYLRETYAKAYTLVG